jgi:hypothetical protein
MLHDLADLLAHLLEERDMERNGRAEAPHRSGRPRAKRAKALALPRPLERTIEVSELNRARARQALQRRGIVLPTKNRP